MYLKIIVTFIFAELIGNMGIFGLPDCGVRSQNLLPQRNGDAGGRDVAIGQFPWVVAIYKPDDNDCESFKQICGGTIVGEKWVATAAHCVCPFNPSVYRIYAGLNDLSQTNLPSVRIYEVSLIFTHPDFVYYNLVNDISLLKTSEPIDISRGDIYINRICLPAVDQNFEDNMVAAGWFQVSKDKQDKQLRKARITVVENSKCNKAYDVNPNDDIEFIDENVICASRRTRQDCFVAIYVAENRSCATFQPICGGTIISNFWVVTAGHCVCPNVPDVYRIIAGFNDMSHVYVPSHRMYKVYEIFMHPDFVYYDLTNDIALLRTSQPIDIRQSQLYINRICLPSMNENFETNATAVGWGLIDDRTKLSKARMSIIENSVCNEAYDSNPEDGIDFINENIMCAERRKANDCFIFSGGSIMKKNRRGVFTIMGIASYGYGCYPFSLIRPYVVPSVYTKVSKYVTWINDVMQNPGGQIRRRTQIHRCYYLDLMKCI